jgi:hypothetical protein
MCVWKMEDNHKKRSRELPEGYECRACGSSEHSIYDCSLYQSRKKTKTKKVKLFLWGLTNSTTPESLESFLNEHEITDPLVKLVMNDRGCKGVGFVTVDESEREKVLALNATDFGTGKFNVKIDSKDPQKKIQGKRCYRCGEKHDSATCNNPRICYRCKRSDHISSECPMKNSK